MIDTFIKGKQMENLVLYIDSSCDAENNCNYFDTLQKEFLTHNLSLEKATTMQAALLAFSKHDYLLVIIIEDYVNFMPQLHIMRELKPIPIIILSTVYEAETAIDALNRGADMYIQRPTTSQEIYACCNAIIRRYKELNNKGAVKASIVFHKNYTMYPEHRKMFINEQEINLTRKEFDLLHLFLRNRGRVLTYEQIISHVWGEDYYNGSNNALTVLISRLRQKLGDDALDCLRNVHDMGYSFDV